MINLPSHFKGSKEIILGLKIRQFQPSDLNQICNIEQLSFPHPWSESEFNLSYRREPQGFLVAIMNGKIIGYVIAEVVSNLDPKKFKFKRSGHLLNIAVHPDFRRKGIGGTLMKTINTYLREKSSEDVWLEVRVSNSIAKKFYLDMGFKETGRKYRYYFTEDALVMVKEFGQCKEK